MADVKWIKIVTDVFDDEKILLIESMPDHDAIIVIWFKLLCLAGKNNNKGVFTLNNRIAYTDEMLSTIFRRPLNTVRLALKTFEQYGMIELINGVITIPNWGKHQTLDQLEAKRGYMREYMANKRSEQKLIASGDEIPSTLDSCKSNCKTNSKANVSTLDKTKNKSKKEIKIKSNNVADYSSNVDLIEAITAFIEMRKSLKKPMTDRAVNMMLNKLDKLSNNDDAVKIEILNQSTMSSWTDIYELKQQKLFNSQQPTKKSKADQDMEALGRMMADYDRCNAEKNNGPMPGKLS